MFRLNFIILIASKYVSNKYSSSIAILNSTSIISLRWVCEQLRLHNGFNEDKQVMRDCKRLSFMILEPSNGYLIIR